MKILNLNIPSCSCSHINRPELTATYGRRCPVVLCQRQKFLQPMNNIQCHCYISDVTKSPGAVTNGVTLFFFYLKSGDLSSRCSHNCFYFLIVDVLWWI